MTDPLSVAGSVVGVISLGIQVTQSLVSFYNSYKGQNSDLIHITENLDSLLVIFQFLENTLSKRNFQADERSVVESIETSIKSCDELIQEMQDECHKFSTASSKGTTAAIKLAGRRVTYPFRGSTLQKLDEDIGEIRANLSFALDVLQLKDNNRMQDDITRIAVLLDSVRAGQVSSDLRHWLNAPDAFNDHNVACAKKHPGTGVWLVKSDGFSRWLTEENSIMWLNGFAGSGKSVLCSTAIQSVLRRRGSNSQIGIAFFYFTFNDQSKQDESGMLRALLLQLSCQLHDGPAELAQLHDRYTSGIPPSSVLLDYLRRLVERFHHAYILLDALDESPRDGPRKHVLDVLEAMRNWGSESLHLFVTSRDESDIRETLDLSPAQQVDMQNGKMDRDINDFISSRFDTDRRLRKFLTYREKIQESLAARAKGMFRWVECQFEALRSCPCSEYHLDRMLNSLPESLDETYERMLSNINYHLIEDARRILTLLCFAQRPLTIKELIDGVAVEIDNHSTGLNCKRRLQDSNGIRDICKGFIDIGFDVGSTTENEEAELTETVRIAHFSVQEYLESERIQHQKAAMFSLTSFTAHAEIAQICLIYLLGPGLSEGELHMRNLEGYPLNRYASKHWYNHYRYSNNSAPVLDDYILKLFERRDLFVAWIGLHNPDLGGYSSPDDIPDPVYYASLMGLEQTLNELLNNGQSEQLAAKRINAKGGRYGNALQAATRGGHVEIMHILLNKGADVNAQGGWYDNALRAASYKGCTQAVRILLDRGADVNALFDHNSNPLQEASRKGYLQIMRLLLDKGADMNARSGWCGNALHEASLNGHDQVVQLLLDKGADVNAQVEFHGNVLQVASYAGHDQVLRTLLDNGANINAQGGCYGNALQAASIRGHDILVQMLIDKGADVNAQGGVCEDALEAASCQGHIHVVKILLDMGAATNAESLRRALRSAKEERRGGVVQLIEDYAAASGRKLSVGEETWIDKTTWSCEC